MRISLLFIRLFILDQYNKKIPLPIIDEDFMINVLQTVCNRHRKPNVSKSKTIKKLTQTQLDNFYRYEFLPLVGETRPLYENKSYILNEHKTQLLTCLSNNLSAHFLEYLNKYLNRLFRFPQQEIIKQEVDKQKRKQLR